jgi:hypothetical protein
VIEWQVFVFGTISNRHFDVWIGLNGEEDVSFGYDPAALPADPSGQDFAVRAENVIGQGDDLGALPMEDLRVASTAPVPGESASYSVTVKGARTGDRTVWTEMEADTVPGITVEKDTIHVSK